MYNKWAKYTRKGITLLCDASPLKKEKKLDRMNTRHGERIDQVNEKLKEKRIEVNELQLEDKIHGVLQKHASDQNLSTDIAALEDKIVHTVGQRLGAESTIPPSCVFKLL